MRRIAKPYLARQRTTKIPSCRFPLHAGGTERARVSVPLAKRGNLPSVSVPLAQRGEPQGGGLIWRWVWVLVVVSCWLQATAQPADLSQDSLLQRRITVWLKMEPLRDALRTIGKQTGVALRCQDAIADEKVAIFVRERPAHEILTQLAGALRYAWRKDEDAYVLYVPDETRQAEEKAARAIREQRAKTLREILQAAREFAAVPIEQRIALRKKLRESPEETKKALDQRWLWLVDAMLPVGEGRYVADSDSDVARYEETGVYSYMFHGVAWMCLASLPERGVNALIRGEWVGFSTKPAEGVYLFPPEARLPLIMRNTITDLTKAPVETDAEPQNPELVGVWTRYHPRKGFVEYRLASVCKRRFINSNGVNDSVQIYFEDRYLTHMSIDALEARVLDYWAQWATPAEELENLLKARLSSTVKLPPPPQYPSRAFAREDLTTADMLEQIARLTNAPIIADAFRTARVQAHDLRLRLDFIIEDLSEELWLRWDKSGYLLGRHQRYWERRPAEMPEAWLRPLEEKYRQRTLELWDYVELAGKMTQEQIDSLYYVDQPLTQFDLTPLQDCLLALRFLASLNATQRQAFASGAWLPAAQLTPPQQRRFAESLGDRFPPLQQLFREPIPPVDMEVNHGQWRSRRGDTYLESHVEETDAQSEPTQLPDAPAMRVKKYPDMRIYTIEGERESITSTDPNSIRETLSEGRVEIHDGKWFTETYQVSVIEFTAPNRLPKRYLFAIEYRDPYTLPAEPAQKTDTEDSEKP